MVLSDRLATLTHPGYFRIARLNEAARQRTLRVIRAQSDQPFLKVMRSLDHFCEKPTSSHVVRLGDLVEIGGLWMPHDVHMRVG